MSMLKSKTGLRVFRLRGDLPENLAERLGKNAVGDLSGVHSEPEYFWATHRHMADGAITEESIRLGGYRVFQLVRAVRRVSPSLLKTEVAAQVAAQLKDTGLPFIGKAELKEIREAVKDQLAQEAQFSLSANMLVICGRHVFTDAVSDAAADAVALNFVKATGVLLERCSWLLQGLDEGMDVSAIRPASFSPRRDDNTATDDIGAEFLTWLWYGTQREQEDVFGVHPLHGPVDVVVMGPLHLESEECMATEAKFSGERATLSPEVATALQDGKKLTKCRLALGIAGELYQGVFNGTEGTWTGLALPFPQEDLGTAERFEPRVIRMERLAVEVMPWLFRRFAGHRLTPGSKVVEQMREWVSGMGVEK